MHARSCKWHQSLTCCLQMDLCRHFWPMLHISCACCNLPPGDVVDLCGDVGVILMDSSAG